MQKGQAHQVTSQQGEEKGLESKDFNKEEIEKLQNFLAALEKPSSTCSLAHSGKCPISHGLNVSERSFRNLWIIDSGATDHMTHASQTFSTYTPCPSN